jgi:hypothetical protein
MAKNATWSTVERTAKLNAIIADFNTGYLRIYDGAQPAGPDTAITTQNLLSTLRFGATAFTVSAGVATANAITQDSSAALTGTAAWYRTFKSDGTTPLHDGTVGTAGTNMVIATTAIVAAAVVSCSSFTLTDAAASAL